MTDKQMVSRDTEGRGDDESELPAVIAELISLPLETEWPTWADARGLQRPLSRLDVMVSHLVVATGWTGAQIADRCGLVRASVNGALGKQHVKEYVRRLAMDELGTASVKALAVMTSLMDHNDPEIRRKAAQDILNRGIGTVSRHQVNHSGSVNLNINL